MANYKINTEVPISRLGLMMLRGRFINRKPPHSDTSAVISSSIEQHEKQNGNQLAAAQKLHGLLPDDFDADAYLALNPDVASSVVTLEEAAIHYLMYGRSEGRRYVRRLLIALDGHDGSGKSTIAEIITRATGGEIVKPFGGIFGQYLLWLSGSRQYELLCQIAQQKMEEAIQARPGSHPLIIDRHALTINTLVSSKYHHRWKPLANSLLCFADFDTVIERLSKRGETIGDLARHARGIQRYRDLAERNGVPVFTTVGQTASVVATRALEALGLHQYASEIRNEPS